MDEQKENLQPEQNTEGNAAASPKAERGREAMSFLHDLVYLLAIVTILFTFFFRLVAVDGSSMYPTLVDKDYLVLESNFLYRDVKQGDIVVLKVDYFEKPIVKRVIATGGQTVDIDFETGDVSVDGEVLREDYINALTTVDGGVHFPLTVAEGCIFVLGDNRGISKDSRYPDVGQIDRREVLGKAIFLMYPGTDEGTYPREFERVGAV